MSITRNTARRSYEPESGMEFSMTHPSSVTFGSSTPDSQVSMLEKWIGSLPDSPANPLVWLENGRGPGTIEICGRQQLSALARYDRSTHCWKMCQELLAIHTSGKSKPTWPKSFMTVSGYLYPLPKSARIKSENESGFWPTLTTRDYRNSSHRERNNKAGLDLIGFLCRETGESGIRLKPTFAEDFQGYPIGWTELKPLEMDGFRRWLKQF